MKRNLDLLIILCACLLVCGIVYIMCGNIGKKTNSYTEGSITFREFGSHTSLRRGSYVQNFDFSDGFTGVVSSSVGESRVTSSSSSYKYQGLLSARPATSSKSLLSSQVTHGSATGARVNVGGSGSSNFVQRSVSAPVAQPNISMPVYAQALKISPSLMLQPRSVSSADVEVARRSLVSTAPGSSSFSFLSSAYSSYQPSVYGKGITLSREGALDYGNVSVQRRVGGRPSTGGLGGGGLGDSWLEWLDKNYGESVNFNNTTAKKAYNDWKAEFERNNKGVIPPSYEEWLEWLQSGGLYGYQINGHTYKFPIGDIVPLILMALSYLVMMFVCKRKLAK